MCATSARLTASSFWAEMVAVSERPHDLSDMALVLQRRLDRDLFICPSADERSLRQADFCEKYGSGLALRLP